MSESHAAAGDARQGLRVVIDTNALQSDELWGFLAMSSANVAVLPDYVVMESFKPGRLDGLRSAVSVLKDFPRQVLALRGTGDVCRLDPGVVLMPDAMVSPGETAAFGDFCRLILHSAEAPSIAQQLEERATWAQEHMAVMVAGLSGMEVAMAEFRAPFTKAELGGIRRNEAYTPAMGRKVFDLVISMAERILELRPDVTPPALEDRPQHFVFRHALAYAAYMLSRIRAGAVARKASLARNDAIDVLIATYGTYFDGVMSEDHLTNEVQYVSRQLLKSLGVPMTQDYVPDGMTSVVDYLEAHGRLAG